MELEDRSLSFQKFMRGVAEGGILVDLREEEHTQFGAIPRAVFISVKQPQMLYQLPKDKKIYLYCQKGKLSKVMLELMVDAGYDAYQLDGGYLTYLQSLV